MNAVEAILVQYGACPRCGHGLIAEHVPIGKTYTIDLATVEEGGIFCGGCHGLYSIKLVKALDRDGSWRFLPFDVLELCKGRPS